MILDQIQILPTFYYIPGTAQTVKYLIQNLECHTNLVGRNTLYDRLYLIPMAQWLLDRGIASVELCNQIEKESQLKLKIIKGRETNPVSKDLTRSEMSAGVTKV